MYRALIILLGLFSVAKAQQSFKNVAIIGGGVGAASAALHLRELVQGDLDIDLFEKSDHLGGRVLSITLDNQTIELGASIVHEANKLVARMAKISNLTIMAPPQGSLFALYDGTKLVFTESPWRIITFIKFLWHYGFQPWFFKNQASGFLQKFQQIYDFQDSGLAFERPHELLRKLGCFYLTQMSFVQYIQDTFHSYPRFASEIVASASKVNYNQENIQLNAFAGLVSLLPATDSRVFHIKEGNEQLVTGTLTAAGATVHLNSPVTSVSATSTGQFEVAVVGQAPKIYDAVIIAAPLGDSGIKISGVTLPIIPRRDYQTTVVTIVKGAVRPTFFGLPPGHMPYGSVMVTEAGSAVPFNSLSKVGTAGGFKAYYKLFSRAPIPEAWLSMLFVAGYEIPVTHSWEAYPAFDPPENFPPFQLAEGLYYNSAAENAASAMEIAAIEGRNVALLAANYFAKPKSSFSGVSHDKGDDDGVLRQGVASGLQEQDMSAAAAAAA